MTSHYSLAHKSLVTAKFSLSLSLSHTHTHTHTHALFVSAGKDLPGISALTDKWMYRSETCERKAMIYTNNIKNIKKLYKKPNEFKKKAYTTCLEIGFVLNPTLEGWFLVEHRILIGWNKNPSVQDIPPLPRYYFQTCLPYHLVQLLPKAAYGDALTNILQPWPTATVDQGRDVLPCLIKVHKNSLQGDCMNWQSAS